MNSWLRFYAETLDDPKVQNLSDRDYKMWVNLLCVACKNNGALPGMKDLAFALRATEDETERGVSTLIKANLIDEHKNQHGLTLSPHNWAKRQFKSDSSTERVKRFRNAARNDDVAASESEAEQKQNKERKTRSAKPNDTTFSLNGLQESFDQFWQTYPRKAGKGMVEKIWAKLKPNEELLQAMLEKLAIQKKSPNWTKNAGEFIPNPATWLGQKRWLDEPMTPEEPAFDWKKNV